MIGTAHHEKHFEAHIVQKLREQGWLVGTSAGYDVEHALYPEDLVAWIQETQEDKWNRLVAANGTKATDVLMARLAKALEERGTIHTLRRGFAIAGCGQIDVSEAAPEDKRNESVVARYAANRLRVVPQLKYHPAREFAIDLVFFFNGLPVATLEVKTDFTQRADAAVEQYKNDRLPIDPTTRRKEPLLSFNRGAIVHFAMSESDIQMTTKLDGAKTFFLPFNQGRDGRAGNPSRADGEYPVAYFWEDVCQRDAWIRIFHDFIYIEKRDVVDLKGNWSKQERLIFPRFHQWTAVNKIIADARKNGPGMPYLCEHSAGSGKTSTIAWTAHDLVKMRRDDGTPIFDTVIVVTDRTVLDSQLQEAVQQLDHQKGLIAAIDRDTSSKSKSQQLTEALLKGVPIIVVTIQTFPYAMEAILTEQSLKEKNFGVIIDEAHASQTGTTASKLQATLALQSKDKMEAMSIEELLEEIQRSRVRPKNISYFAFTATPKHSTYMLFGRRPESASSDTLPEAFHCYPMRQAIDEGFILDVLEGYVPYKTAFNLSKHLLDDKRVDGKSAKRALARWMATHPTNVTQKVQFIVQHFSANVMHRLDGKAKAMVVTSSRPAAVRYKKGFDAYLKKHPEHKGIRALVAFSGKLSGTEVIHAEDGIAGEDFIVHENEEFTEISMNPDIRGTDLRVAFDRPEYRVMLVADKFQTGFDQPKLVAMYIDKKIGNDVEIVQTLSRLNRTAPGKDVTYIIDFANDPEKIRAAFEKYDTGASIDKEQDPNVIYTIKGRLDEAGFYDDSDIETFKQARFKSIQTLTGASSSGHKELYAATQAPADAFNNAMKTARSAVQAAENAYETASNLGNEAGMKQADFERKEAAHVLQQLLGFKADLSKFVRTYHYIAQLIEMGDPQLEAFAAFAKLLAKRLDGVAPEAVDLRGLLLTGFDIKPKEYSPTDTDEPEPLRPVGAGAGKGPVGMPVHIAEIIEQLNALFGDATPLKDRAAFADQTLSILSENSLVMAQVESNTKDQALKGSLPGSVMNAVVRAMTSHNGIAEILLKDPQTMRAYTSFLYDLLKEGKRIDIDVLESLS